ncbi:MAG: ABC transporter permease [Planctomycetota bacterium]
MVSYISRRLLLMIPTLVGITAVVFFVMALAPGQFSGLTLDPEGAQEQGQDTRRALQYVNRRYGLDQPVYVQYLRWLNQVSPFGFRTSDRIELDPADLEAVRQALSEPAQTRNDRALTALAESVLRLALYRGESWEAVLERLTRALEEPLAVTGEGDTAVPAGIAFIRQTGDDTRLSESDFEKAMGSERQARVALRQAVVYEVNSRSRVLFTRPAIKWPNFGIDRNERPVLERLGEAVPITLLLSVITIPIVYFVSIVTGVYAARKRGVFDFLSGTVMLGLWSFPIIGAGVLLIVYFASVDYLQWFPTAGLESDDAASMRFLPSFNEDGFARGWLLDRLWHLVLPLICLTYTGFAVLTKLTRGAVLDNLAQDYARAARAKGVAEGDILWRHVFRNSLLPLITMAASILPSLIVGSVVVENIFSIQGMGKLGVDAAFANDRELILGVTLIGGLIGLTSELIRDVCYAIADPRVSYD